MTSCTSKHKKAPPIGEAFLLILKEDYFFDLKVQSDFVDYFDLKVQSDFVDYLFSARSMATAMATVAPTMGLLPMPR